MKNCQPVFNFFFFHGGWLIYQWRNETTQPNKKNPNCQPIISSFLWQNGLMANELCGENICSKDVYG